MALLQNSLRWPKNFKKIEHVYKTKLLKELVYNKRAGLIYCIRKAPREKSSVEQTVAPKNITGIPAVSVWKAGTGGNSPFCTEDERRTPANTTTNKALQILTRAISIS